VRRARRRREAERAQRRSSFRAGATAVRACARTHPSASGPSASAASAARSAGKVTLNGPRAFSTSRTSAGAPTP
jgi:hypothetical protein